MKITSISQQQTRQNRYSIFVDGKFAFSLSDGALLDSGIINGQEIDQAQLEGFTQLSLDDKAYERALNYAVLRPRSVWEVQDYLRRKDIKEHTSQSILNRLSNIGLLDDREFAARWINNRRLLKSTSRRKLQLELKQKHVPGDIIDEVLNEDKEHTNEVEVLRQLIEHKSKRYPDKQKLMAYLSRQGYNYGDIKTALEESGY